MTITFYGHAVLRIQTKDKKALLCDPWFSRSGAFFRSWFQFPENADFEIQAFEAVQDVLISHNHQDHYDPAVLKRALERQPNLQLHIAAFATDWFKSRIEAELPDFRDRLHVHEAFTEFDVAGGRAYFVPEESPGQIDSAIVFFDDHGTVVNMNDARLNTTQLEGILERAGGHISVLALQASGASEYPVNYLYDEQDMLARKAEKRRLKFEACESIISCLNPDRILFFAGPPVFLDPALAAHNDISQASVFPDQLDILKHYESCNQDISDRSYFLLPGEVLDDSRLWNVTDLSAAGCSAFRDKLSYIESYRERRREELNFETLEIENEADMAAHFEGMAQLSRYASERIGGKISFVVVGDEREFAYTVDFQSGKAYPGLDADPLYVLRLPMAAFAAVLRNEATWDDIFLSLRMSFEERSPRFVAHFKTLLKYMDPGIMAALQEYETRLEAQADSDYMTVQDGEHCFIFQRHCPHAGVDLEKHGRVNEDGTITCMAHRFQFDMRSGRCLNAEGYKLATKRP